MFALGVAATMAAVTTPRLATSLDDARASAAARYVSTLCQRTRWEAVQRHAAAGVRFELTPGGYTVAAYVDGNANGVLTRDIQSGIDRSIFAAEAIGDRFPGIEFAAGPGVPAV